MARLFFVLAFLFLVVAALTYLWATTQDATVSATPGGGGVAYAPSMGEDPIVMLATLGSLLSSVASVGSFVAAVVALRRPTGT